jgi:hypothetical protein
MNQPFAMVALVGSMKGALQDSNHYLEEWMPVTKNHFIKIDKKLRNKKNGNFKSHWRDRQECNASIGWSHGITKVLPMKISVTAYCFTNEEILEWLKTCHPELADSFASNVHISTNKINVRSTVANSSHKQTVVENVIRHYQDLNVDGQKDLWLGVFASNDTELIRELTALQVHSATLILENNWQS